jgi:hypothetical protein
LSSHAEVDASLYWIEEVPYVRPVLVGEVLSSKLNIVTLSLGVTAKVSDANVAYKTLLDLT